MAEVLVLEFSTPNAVSTYKKVNEILGWVGPPKPEDLPAGMITHVAGEAGEKLVVVEVWESQAAQATFMETQLGPALAKADVPPPARAEWFNGLADGR